jgi:hypothetical protein
MHRQEHPNQGLLRGFIFLFKQQEQRVHTHILWLSFHFVCPAKKQEKAIATT